MRISSTKRILSFAASAAFALLIACQGKKGTLSLTEKEVVKDSVIQMADNIMKDISTKGPAAWVDYFEDDPGFFMASGGVLSFKSYKVGKTYTLDTVAKAFSKISLGWKNYRIDALTTDYASFGADFHEDITLAGGKQMSVDGYVTATAHFDRKRWKLRNMNWAIAPPRPTSK